MKDLNSIHCGNSLDWLRTIPTGVADAIITDPPYSSGGQYRGDRMGDTNKKYLNNENADSYASFAGDNRDQHSFRYWCALWLAEALRITKPGGVLCCFTDWRQLPTTTDAVQAGGWVWRGIWVWDKTEGARPQMGRFRSQCEYVAWGSNGPMSASKEIGVLPGLCRSAIKKQDKLHTTGKPLDVMTDLMRIMPAGGLVVDPFAGSGTTCLAAKLSGRSFLGCELLPEYCEIARKRVAECFAPMTKEKHYAPGLFS